MLSALLVLALLELPCNAGHTPPTYGTTTVQSSSAAASCAQPKYTYEPSFSYTSLYSNRVATPVSSPLTYTTSYAPPFATASKLLPKQVKYTTYSLDPKATQGGKYGASAFAALWKSYSFTDTVPFTTTRAPTPVAQSELVYPPAMYTACPETADTCLNGYCLPKDFVWGVAGSAWQIEGGPYSEGRGPSLLDQIGNQLGKNATANDSVIADMDYFLYKQDIARLAAVGIPYYSFTISWSRIVPFGVKGSPVNTLGLDHYEDVLQTCIDNGITPIITLLHADNPVSSPFNASGFADDLLYYAKQVMTRFGDRVPYWVTINEPNINTPTYASNLNVLMGHAQVYHWYKEVLKGTGQLTFKFANNIAIPLDGANPDDVKAALRYQDFIVGIEGNPVYLGEQYPDSVLSTKNISLPKLTNSQLAYIANTSDFLSIDPYTMQFATSPPGGIDACAADPTNANWPQCVVLSNIQSNGWDVGDQSFAYAYMTPEYFRMHMGYLWKTFRPHGILIAEFGFNPWAEYERPLVGQRYDYERTMYYHSFLREMLKCIFLDGIKIIGALGWSAMDNNEFGSYEQQYGMQVINRTAPYDSSAFMQRSYKRSIFDYVDFFQQRVQK